MKTTFRALAAVAVLTLAAWLMLTVYLLYIGITVGGMSGEYLQVEKICAVLLGIGFGTAILAAVIDTIIGRRIQR